MNSIFNRLYEKAIKKLYPLFFPLFHFKFNILLLFTFLPFACSLPQQLTEYVVVFLIVIHHRIS